MTRPGSVRTASGRELRRTWNIKARDLNRKLRVARLARIGDLRAVVDATGRPISLRYFGARGLKRGGVSFVYPQGEAFHAQEGVYPYDAEWTCRRISGREGLVSHTDERQVRWEAGAE